LEPETANACELKSTVLSPGDFVVTLSDGTAIKAAANTSIEAFVLLVNSLRLS
jgi:hypothetical protein